MSLLNATNIQAAEQGIPQDDYAMWFPSDIDKSFTHSDFRQSINRLYEQMAGIETYIVAEVLKMAQKIPTDIGRLALPDQLFLLPFKTSQDIPFIVSMSEEKGIRLHFAKMHSSAKDKMEVLVEFSNFSSLIKNTITMLGGELDEHEHHKPIEWWQMCEEEAINTEARGDELQGLGMIGANNLFSL